MSERYLALEPRSLGLARIYLGVLLLWDLVRRAPELSLWYTNDGLLPNHTVLFRPQVRHTFSFFFSASWPGEVALLFVLVGAIYLAFLLGWHTRLFHALSFACLVSLHGRVVFLDNGGDVVLRLLAGWTLFLPMGARFSVDAVRASMRGRIEHTAADLADRAALPRETRSAVSLAVAALLAQAAVIYFMSAVPKDGASWREGSGFHYLLHQDRVVTWLGWKLRPHVTPDLSRVLTWSALAIEFVAPVLLLSPLAWRWSRRVALVLLPALHIGLALFLNLGLFSFAMIGFLLPLVLADDWAWLSRRFTPSQVRARVVYFDGECGICFQFARLLARWDAAGRLTLVANQDRDRVPIDLDRTLLDRTMVVEDPVSRRRWTRSDGFAQAFAAVPWGWPVAALLWTPGLRGLAGRLYDVVARNRTRISVALGLAACGLPARGSVAGVARDGRGSSWPRLRAWGGVAREVSVIAVALACTIQTQGWHMLAPEPSKRDRMLVVDAVTADGRHVDPFNQLASRTGSVPVAEIPEYLDQNAAFRGYVARIKDRADYHQALRAWIDAYPLRTGRAQDRLVSYQVFILDDDSPLPGQTRASDSEKRLLFRSGGD